MQFCNFNLKNRALFAETLAVIYVTLLALFGLEGGGGGAETARADFNFRELP